MSVARDVATAMHRFPPAYRLLRRSYTWLNDRLPPRDVPGVGKVHRNDLMFDAGSPGAAEHYSHAGQQAAAFVEEFCNFRSADAVLDFGCGHGRVARVLASRLAHGKLSVCDLDPSAVKFCREAFGATAVQGHPDPRQLALGSYDVIWMGSVLTHLPREAALVLTERLASVLRPAGLLLFTTHGEFAERHAAELAERAGVGIDELSDDLACMGWAYRQYRHADGVYGLAWQRAAGVRAMVALAAPELKELAHRPNDWSGWQDLWAFRAPGDL